MKIWHTVNTHPNPEIEAEYKKACVIVDAVQGTVKLTSGVDENGWVHVFELVPENIIERREVEDALKKGRLLLRGLDFRRFSMYKDEKIIMTVEKV